MANAYRINEHRADGKVVKVTETGAGKRREAQLIAAAPDLLAVCKALIEANEHEDFIPDSVWYQAEIAIDKAEGANA